MFLAGPYGDKIRCYCLKTENDFKNLIEDFFLIKDSGYSCHKLFGSVSMNGSSVLRKVESCYLRFILQNKTGNKVAVKKEKNNKLFVMINGK